MIAQWLAQLDHLPLECDGMTNIISTLLHREGIKHQVCIGSLTIPAGTIPLHYWITLDKEIIDFRARMWLGPTAPHGIFLPEPDQYDVAGLVDQRQSKLSAILFWGLTGQTMESFPTLADFKSTEQNKVSD